MAGLFKWGTRKDSAATALPVPIQAEDDPRLTSKVLPRFLAALASAESPVLLNLGPVVGQNISFFGDRLSCKIFVEDLSEAVDEYAMRESAAGLAEELEQRLKQHGPGAINGILCWDLFDFLDRATSRRLAARLATLLRPGGVLYGFFGTLATDVAQHARFVIEAPDTLRLRSSPSATLHRHVLVTRDINKMFEGLVVAESILLKTCTRETLFRKP